MRRHVIPLLLALTALLAACTPPSTSSGDAAELAHFLPCTTQPSCVISNVFLTDGAISDDGRILLTPSGEHPGRLQLVGLQDRWVRRVLDATGGAIGVSGDATLDLVAVIAAGVVQDTGPDPDGADADLYLYDRSSRRLWRPAQPAGYAQSARVSADGSRVGVVVSNQLTCRAFGGASVAVIDVAADTVTDLGPGYDVDLSADGQVAAVMTNSFLDRDRGDIVIHDLAAGTATPVGETAASRGASTPRLSADGTKLAYWIDDQPDEDGFEPYARGTKVVVRDLTTGGRTVVAAGPASKYSSRCVQAELAITAGGSRVLLTRDRTDVGGGASEVLDVDAGGAGGGQIAAGLILTMVAASHSGDRVITIGAPTLVPALWNR